MKLDYEIPERAPAELKLECAGGRHTFTFPLTPRWTEFAWIGLSWTASAIFAGLGGWVLWKYLQLPLAYRPVQATSPIRLLVAPLFLSLMFGFGGGFSLYHYRRRGHIPRCVWVDAGTKVLGHRRERSSRRTEWPVGEICKIRVKEVSGFRGILSGVILIIRIRGHGPSLTVRSGVARIALLHEFARVLVALAPEAKVRWAHGSKIL